MSETPRLSRKQLREMGQLGVRDAQTPSITDTAELRLRRPSRRELREAERANAQAEERIRQSATIPAVTQAQSEPEAPLAGDEAPVVPQRRSVLWDFTADSEEVPSPEDASQVAENERHWASWAESGVNETSEFEAEAAQRPAQAMDDEAVATPEDRWHEGLAGDEAEEDEAAAGAEEVEADAHPSGIFSGFFAHFGEDEAEPAGAATSEFDSIIAGEEIAQSDFVAVDQDAEAPAPVLERRSVFDRFEDEEDSANSPEPLDTPEAPDTPDEAFSSDESQVDAEAAPAIEVDTEDCDAEIDAVVSDLEPEVEVIDSAPEADDAEAISEPDPEMEPAPEVEGVPEQLAEVAPELASWMPEAQAEPEPDSGMLESAATADGEDLEPGAAQDSENPEELESQLATEVKAEEASDFESEQGAGLTPEAQDPEAATSESEQSESEASAKEEDSVVTVNAGGGARFGWLVLLILIVIGALIGYLLGTWISATWLSAPALGLDAVVGSVLNL